MGCSPGDNECNDDEKPAHKVRITKGFCMDMDKVTLGKYKNVMGNNSLYFSSCGSDCPVGQVDWNEAKSYCEKIGGRLPTEAEWEYAARAGTTTKYYWGDSMDENKGPNKFGLYDISENICEWVNDWYDRNYYALSPESDPEGPHSGELRVLRGGCWNDLRVSVRDKHNPSYKYYNVRFRCVKN